MDICILLACTHHIDALGWCRTRHPLWVWEAWLLINLTRNMGQLNKTLKKSVSQIKKKEKCATCCAWQFGLCTYTVNTAWKLSLLFFFLKNKSASLTVDAAASSSHWSCQPWSASCLSTVLLGNSWHGWIWLDIWMGTCACTPVKQPRHFTHICSRNTYEASKIPSFLFTPTTLKCSRKL